MWIKNNSDELYHYGVLGMKWGIRKTSIYTKNNHGDIYTDRQKKRMARVASKAIKRERNRNISSARSHDKASEHFKKKGDMASYKMNKQKAKDFLEMSKINEKRLKDIESGKLKAGRDYVVNTEISTMPILDAVGLINVSVQDSVSFRNKK